jgi:hypothetical protein
VEQEVAERAVAPGEARPEREPEWGEHPEREGESARAEQLEAALTPAPRKPARKARLDLARSLGRTWELQAPLPCSIEEGWELG